MRAGRSHEAPVVRAWVRVYDIRELCTKTEHREKRAWDGWDGWDVVACLGPDCASFVCRVFESLTPSSLSTCWLSQVSCLDLAHPAWRGQRPLEVACWKFPKSALFCTLHIIFFSIFGVLRHMATDGEMAEIAWAQWLSLGAERASRWA